MAFVIDPVFTLRNIGPSANIGESFRQSVDIALGAVNAFDLPGHPIVGNPPIFMQKLENPLQK